MSLLSNWVSLFLVQFDFICSYPRGSGITRFQCWSVDTKVLPPFKVPYYCNTTKRLTRRSTCTPNICHVLFILDGGTFLTIWWRWWRSIRRIWRTLWTRELRCYLRKRRKQSRCSWECCQSKIDIGICCVKFRHLITQICVFIKLL